MILAVLTAGVIADRYGHRVVIITGIALWVIGLAIFSMCQHLAVIFLVWILIGIGFGAIDTGLNALVAQVSTARGKALNRLHFWFGIGSLTGPIVAGVILTFFSWRVLFSFAGIIALAYLIYMRRLDYPQPEKVEKETQVEQSSFKQLLIIFQLPILFLGLIMFGYTGVSTTFTGWINTYLTSEVALSTTFASLILSLYSIGLSGGRLVISMIAEKVPYERLLAVSAITALVFASIALTSTNTVLITIAFGLTGFCFAALLPISLALGSKLYPDITGTVTGILIFFGSIGRTILPAIVGFVGDYSSLASSLRLSLIVIGLVIFAAVGLIVTQKKEVRNVKNI